MAKVFDAKHPIESFKALVLEMMKGYRFDVEGLYLKGGTVTARRRALALGVLLGGHALLLFLALTFAGDFPN